MNLTKEQVISRAWSPKVESKVSMSSEQVDAQVAAFLGKGGQINKIGSSTAPHTSYAANGNR
jgi:hypothetical protein